MSELSHILDKGLVFAELFDGKGGCKSLAAEDLHGWKPEDGVLWAHFSAGDPASTEWMRDQLHLPVIVREALMEPGTRPRCESFRGGVLINLRGVNHSPGADPEDMVSLRIWIEGRRILSTRRERLLSAEDVRKQLSRGDGPKDEVTWIAAIADALIDRMGPALNELDSTIDSLEDRVTVVSPGQIQSELAEQRRTITRLRRFLAPQRDALAALCRLEMVLADKAAHASLVESQNRVQRLVEDLEAMRDHAAITQDQLATRVNEQMNRRMLALSIITAVFLPLGLLTGLLGINVAGIPFAESPRAFGTVCAVIVVLAIAQLSYLKQRRWF